MTPRRKKLFLKALVEDKVHGSLLHFLANLAKSVWWQPGHTSPVVPPDACFYIAGPVKSGKTYLAGRINQIWPSAKVIEKSLCRAADMDPAFVVAHDPRSCGAHMVILLSSRPGMGKYSARILKSRFHSCTPSREFWIEPRAN